MWVEPADLPRLAERHDFLLLVTVQEIAVDNQQIINVVMEDEFSKGLQWAQPIQKKRHTLIRLNFEVCLFI